MFETTHKLPFLSRLWIPTSTLTALFQDLCKDVDPIDWMEFRVGTCVGLWRQASGAYQVLAIDNEVIANGHFTDVMEWFEYSAQRDGFAFEVLHVWNKRLMDYLLDRGFSLIPDTDSVRKEYAQPKSGSGG